MPDTALRDIDAALSDLQRLARPGKPSATTPPGARARHRWGVGRVLAGLLLVGVVPFPLFVRAATWLFAEQGWPPWGAVAGAGLGTAAVMLLGLLGVWRAWRLGWSVAKGLAVVVLGAVLLYGSYALLYISPAHVKDPALQSTYTALHPLLRLSVSTLVLVDRDAVVTDTGREPADYERMGLPVLQGSRHYMQPDGYVHAVDLRTKGRAEWKNTVMRGYFAAMGLQTLRHVGTADHLHVALPPPTR